MKIIIKSRTYAKKDTQVVIIFSPAESKTIKNGKTVQFDSDRLDEEKESGQSLFR